MTILTNLNLLRTWTNHGAKPGADIPCTEGCAHTAEVSLMCRACAQRELAVTLDAWDPTGFSSTGYAVDVRLPYATSPELALAATNWCQQEISHLLQGFAFNRGTMVFLRADELILKPGLGIYGPRLSLLWFPGQGAERIPDVKVFCLFKALLTGASEVAKASGFSIKKLEVGQIPGYLADVLATDLTDMNEILRCREAWKNARRSMSRWTAVGAISNSLSLRAERSKTSAQVLKSVSRARQGRPELFRQLGTGTCVQVTDNSHRAQETSRVLIGETGTITQMVQTRRAR